MLRNDYGAHYGLDDSSCHFYDHHNLLSCLYNHCGIRKMFFDFSLALIFSHDSF